MKKKIVLICFVILMLFVNGCKMRGTELSELTNVYYNSLVSIDYSSHFCQSYSNKMDKKLFEEFFDIINVKYEGCNQKEIECDGYATYRITLSNNGCAMLIVRLSNGKLYCEYFNGNETECYLSTSKVYIPLKFINLK